MLQEEKPVMISAEGAGVGILPVGMDSSHVSIDHQPMRLYAPVFTTKTIGHSTPYPGVNNTITVTVATNFNMVKDTRIVMHGFEGAIISDGDVKLQGADAANFVSLDGTNGHGTWLGCDKAIVLVLNSALGCNTSSFVVSFVVENQLQAQDCVGIRINATVPSCLTSGTYLVTQARVAPHMSNAIGSRAIDSYSEDYMAHSEDGFDMDHDLTTKLPVFGAMMGDACPLLIWPAAFLIRDISQSSPYPCANNVISITLATNVLLLPSDEAPASITVSDMYLAEPDTGSTAVSVATASGALTSQDDLLTNATWNVNDDSNMSSVTLSVQSGQECCAPDVSGNGLIVITFNVTNAKTPQSASRYVSIAAAGSVVISAMPMHNDYGNKWPFYVKTPQITLATIAQSSSAPCSLNTISIQLKFNSELVCASNVTITGLSSFMACDHVENITGAGFRNVRAPDCAAEGVQQLIVSVDQFLPKGDAVDLEFSFVNPGDPVLDKAVAPSVAMSMSGYVTDRIRIDVPTDVLRQPLTVTAAAFNKAVIVQSTSFPGEVNTITVTFSTSSALKTMGDCESAITISGLQGACVGDSTLQLSGDSQALAHNATLTSGGTALWSDANSTITMFIVKDAQIIADQDYVISFNVTNPGHAQPSHPVSISASGVSLPAIEMSIGAGPMPAVESCDSTACVFPFTYRGVQYTSCTNVDYGDLYWCATKVDNSTAADTWAECKCNVTYHAYRTDAAPLHVRGGQEDFGVFKIGQNSSQPGAANRICVTFSTNVPLVSSLPVLVTVAGLSGAVAPSGAISSVQTPDGHFTSTWNDADKKLILGVVQDTIVGAEYTICTVVTNPSCAQSSPKVHIESSGIVIQPTAPTYKYASQANAVLHVTSPEIIGVDIEQVDSTGGGANELTITFTSTVDLTYEQSKMTAVVVRGLQGVHLSKGAVPISGASSSMFSSCSNASSTGCQSGTASWGDGKDTLTLFLVSSVTANEVVELKLPFTNANVSQGGVCSATLEIQSKQLGCAIGPVPLVSSPALIGTAREALRIQVASSSGDCFSVMSASQSSAAPGATNTITLSLRPPVSLTSDYTVVISGLVGASTPDSMLQIINRPSGKRMFRPRARWTASSGTLILGIAGGQVLSSNETSVVQFDLANPNYPQDSPAVIDVSVPGHENITKCALTPADDDAAPLKVVSPQFTVRSVEQSSNMPGGENTIRVSLRPNVLLSKTRRSVIVIDGLRGSRTFDTSVLINVEQGSGLVPEATWRQSTGTLSIAIDGEVGTSSDIVFSFKLENGYISQEEADSPSVLALGDMPIGASWLQGSIMRIADLKDAEEIFAVCTCPVSSSNASCACDTALEMIALNRSLYVLKVELQCNSGAENLTISTLSESQGNTTTLTGVQQLPPSCHDQCHKYHTILDWTPIDPELMGVRTADSTGWLGITISADGMAGRTDYCGAGDILKAIVTLRVSADIEPVA